MSYNDSYGHEPRPSGRRASREPAGPARIQGSTAAALLVLVAIVGFGIGALIGNSGGGDDTPTTTTEDSDGAPLGTPDDQNADPDDSASDQPTEESSQPPTGTVTLEMDDSAEAGEELEYRVRSDPPQPGLTLGMERRVPGGEWTPFGQDQVRAELDDDGEDEGHVVTGQVGESEWRLVGEIDGQRVESNVVSATITDDDDDDDDD